MILHKNTEYIIARKRTQCNERFHKKSPQTGRFSVAADSAAVGAMRGNEKRQPFGCLLGNVVSGYGCSFAFFWYMA